MIRSMLVAGALLAALSGPAALADVPTVTLTNSTGKTIMSLNLSGTSGDSWGEDVLGEDFLNEGESVAVSFPPEQKACVWDIRVEYHDGSGRLEWRKIDLCQHSRFTITSDSSLRYE